MIEYQSSIVFSRLGILFLDRENDFLKPDAESQVFDIIIFKFIPRTSGDNSRKRRKKEDDVLSTRSPLRCSPVCCRRRCSAASFD